MLFNSFVFLFGFLPGVLVVYQLVSRLHRKAVVIWLEVASLIFYGYWRPAFLLVLATSVLFNFLVSNLISRRIPNRINTSLLLWAAIAGNVGVLCWFKYLFPVLNFFSEHLHTGHSWSDVALPLGISFFTFTQIGYLVDLQQGAATQQDFFSYLLFVTFFPHVIAGPILHHSEMMPQFQRDRAYGLQFNDLAVGVSWFAMGMFKKVILADHLARTVGVVFGAHGAVGPGTAWMGVLSYSLQLYFDFSGYCDMANGLARMFSIDFPLNFASPYKSASIIEFWQRWHMTLTRYIGSYLYNPMQLWSLRRRQSKGKKVTLKAQATPAGFAQMIALPTIFTMLVAGVWHGAGLQFVVFGLLHGIYLSVNHGWRTFRSLRKIKGPGGARGRAVRVGSVLLTYSGVVLGQVFFRAPSVHEAMVMLRRMIPIAGGGSGTAIAAGDAWMNWMWIAICYGIVWGLPNTQQLLARYKPSLGLAPSDQRPRWLPIYWKPNAEWGLLLGGVMLVALVELQNPSTFLYFQF